MDDTAQMLEEAAELIRNLRHRNEVLQAKADTLDLCQMMLLTKPAFHVVGAEEDIAWKLAQRGAKLRADLARGTKPTDGS